jgi:hypothetical protein
VPEALRLWHIFFGLPVPPSGRKRHGYGLTPPLKAHILVAGDSVAMPLVALWHFHLQITS